MSQGESLKHQFLVAMPGMDDEYFNHTVSLLCEHSDKGAVGLVINRPTDLVLSAMLDQMGLDADKIDPDRPIYWGGPVQPERGFVVHRDPGGWETCMEIQDHLYVTTSRDILTAISAGEGPSDYIVALGYAGWSPGQLENEIFANSWLNTPLDSSILFQMPPRDRWQAATRLLGVDVTQLTGSAGHA